MGGGRGADRPSPAPSLPQEKGVPPQRLPKLQPLPGPQPALQRPQAPSCPRADPGEFCHARGPGPDSKVAWHCNSLRFNSSGTHYATWHQPLTWLQGGELPGGTGAGSLLGAPLRRGRATSPPVALSQGLEFTVLAPNAPQEIMQNKRGREDGRRRGGRAPGLRPLLPFSPALPPTLLPPLPSPKQRTTATGAESSRSSCSVTSICAHPDEPLGRSHPPRQLLSHTPFGSTPPVERTGTTPTKWPSGGGCEGHRAPDAIYPPLIPSSREGGVRGWGEGG